MGSGSLFKSSRICVLFLLCYLIFQAAAQNCSKDNPCATGCCSKYGYCGTGDEFCGANCVDTCDYKLGCDINTPCAQGCCNKFGFCGLGPDFCGDTCVNNCERRSECDPGFGPEWSEKSSCPLNVCCSKFGFCGTTSEFCGKNKVHRPSCNNETHTLERVVGYYETWSTRRRCKQFWPEQIPLGIYTHINVAFAVIDPETFEVRPALSADIEMYKRVTRLKKDDPDLKVFIALGGWTYNDPGPTATTFSDLAASTENQKKFFVSLTQFMSTYDFDGVDIDWEYPRADDRSGRPEDFDNFPTFLKNLKATLKRTGGRDGLSITLPASYWYLQHFDIQKIKTSVDFFNIMTYDLHGVWDKGNKWTVEALDAHTNLTEISNSLDLLWRNDIPPQQVVLGLAFYGRAFTVADAACTQPGCLFASGAKAGECSHEVGILMNSEIDDIAVKNSLDVTFDKAAAVKMITWDKDQWVSYDDFDTFRLKAEFARGLCLGGLMVWAVSHDHPNGTYSRALGGAAQRKFVALPDSIQTDDTIKVKHDQCKWTNCGDLCPTGWVLLRRNDDDKHYDGEWMLDNGGCVFKGEDHRLCCPPDEEPPSCGWYGYDNSGNCEAKCPDDSFELGGTNAGCNTVNGNYQAACCTKGKKSTALYEKCEWGESFHCDRHQCAASKPDVLLTSCNGNGGSGCGGDWWTDRNEERKYCCDTADENMTFDDCEWKQNYTSKQFLVYPAGAKGPFCFSNCPDDKVRVAMEHDNTCSRSTGSRAKCCSPNYTTTTKVVDPLVELWESDLRGWLNNPKCPNAYDYTYESIFDPIAKRAYTNEMALAYPPGSINLSSTSSSLDKRQDLSFITSNQILVLLADIIYSFRGTTRTSKALKEIQVWNTIIGAQFTYLVTTQLIPFLAGVQDELYTAIAEELAGRIVCNLDYWNQMIRDCTAPLPSGTNITCANVDLDKWDSEFSIDPDTYGTNLNIGSTKRSFEVLDKRDGSSRQFTVDCGIDPVTGLQRVLIIESEPYPNGGNGDNLQQANGLTARFALARPGVCTDVSIDPNAPTNLWVWVTEHVLELQLIPRSIEFMVTGTLPSTHGLPALTSTNRPMPWNFAELLTQDYSQWARGHTSATGIPIKRIFNALGSKINKRI